MLIFLSTMITFYLFLLSPHSLSKFCLAEAICQQSKSTPPQYYYLCKPTKQK